MRWIVLLFLLLPCRGLCESLIEGIGSVIDTLDLASLAQLTGADDALRQAA